MKGNILRGLMGTLLVSCFVFGLQAQVDTIPHNYGDSALKGMKYGVSAPDMIDQMMVTMPGLGSNAREMMLEQSVKPYMMPPRNVGAYGSANCYAVSYCLEFYANYRKNYKVNLSPDYIQLSLEKDDLRSAFTFLAEQGTVSAAIMPFESRTINSGVRATNKYKIQNFLHIFRKETKGRQKIFETRRSLMRGNPVLVQMKVPTTFSGIKDTRTWDGNGTPSIVTPLVVVGYNAEMEAFELLGAYGSDWGNNGYLWMKYDDFAKVAENAYVLVPEPVYDNFGR